MATRRYQIDIAEDDATFLDELMNACGITSKKDLFNNALTLLDWAVKETQHGRSIASVDEDNQQYRELNMPILAGAARRSQK